jgi:hypothetical protein
VAQRSQQGRTLAERTCQVAPALGIVHTAAGPSAGFPLEVVREDRTNELEAVDCRVSTEEEDLILDAAETAAWDPNIEHMA